MKYDLVVVGAGPYGLSIASHAAAAGLNVRVFGRPMASWRDHMPRGMLLKSEPWASNLSDPAGRWRLDAYCAERGMTARHAEPMPVETFAAYGLWFARNAVPGVDERMVVRVSSGPGGFTVVTGDGQAVQSRTVALAVGVMPFVEVPPVLDGLRPSLVTHSSDHSDLTRFRGMDVTVVGGGQAALETAALLAEQGSRARVLARAGQLYWNDLPPALERPWWQAVRSPHSGLGPGWRNWFYAERPNLYRRLPEPTRARIAATALGPAGAWWVRDRVERAVELLPGHEIASARAACGGLRLETVDLDGTPRTVETEHVIAATGFRTSCDRFSMLAGELRGTLAALPDGSPEVGHDFESSHPGLFLAGLVTASGFGPAMRFVQGAPFTASALVRGVRRRLRTAPVTVTVPGPGGSRTPSPSPVRH